MTEPQACLLLAADARALLGAGVPGMAAERAAEAQARSLACGAEAMRRLANRVRVRALVSGGRGSDALVALTEDIPLFTEGVPASFRREEALADAVGGLLIGDGNRLMEATARILGDPDGSESARWHGTLARALQAQARAREGAWPDAVRLLTEAIGTAREAGSIAEDAAFSVACGAFRLASGDSEGIGNLADASSLLGSVDTTAGIAVLAGLPLDPAGADGPQALVEALMESAVQRVRLQDATGAVLAVLAAAGMLVHLEASDVAAEFVGNSIQALSRSAPLESRAILSGGIALGLMNPESDGR